MDLQTDVGSDVQPEPVPTLPPDAGRAVLQATWTAVRAGVGQLPAAAPRRPSVLPGWTVGDLIAHLGRSLDMLAATRPAAGDATPLSLRGYLATFRPDAAQIAEITRALAIAAGNEPLAALDAAWQRALATLDELGPADRVVHARRGPLLLSDLLASRVLELVVHADDISRSIPERPPLRLPDPALAMVARVLLTAAAQGCPGTDVEVSVGDLGTARLGPAGGGPGTVRTDRLTWIRLAAGRLTWARALAEHALSVQAAADGEPDAAAPDLSSALPLV